MKKVLMAFAVALAFSCNNGDGKCPCNDVQNYLAQGHYLYMIIKNTSPVTYFYATSDVQLTSATQITDWNSSQNIPRELTGEGVDTLPTETVALADLPQSLRLALQ